MTQKILVTGAAGFIGFHLCQALQHHGHYVIGVDNFNDYYSVELKKQRADLLQKLRIPILQVDVRDEPQLRHLLATHRCNRVIHLAAQAGVRYSMQNPQAYIDANISGFLSLLQASVASSIEHVVYASSSSVYGLNTTSPFKESDITDSPASFYGATKKANELIAHTFHHTHALPITGLRFFTVYGPWGRPDMAYSLFAKAIVAQQPIDLYNNGQMMRDFTFVDDIVQGIIAATTRADPFAIYNLGNNRPVTLEHFVDILEESLGRKAVRRYVAMPPGDVVATCADLTLSREKLQYSPTTPLEKGLPLFCRWFLQQSAS